MIFWNGRNASKNIKLAESPISVLFYKNGNLYAGSQNGNIKILNDKYEQVNLIEVSKLTTFTPGIRAIDVDENENVLIGTKGCEVIFFNL